MMLLHLHYGSSFYYITCMQELINLQCVLLTQTHPVKTVVLRINCTYSFVNFFLNILYVTYTTLSLFNSSFKYSIEKFQVQFILSGSNYMDDS